MKRLWLVLVAFAVLALALGSRVQSSERHQTTCGYYAACIHNTDNLPVCSSGETRYYRLVEGRDNDGHIGALDCGDNTRICYNDIEWTVPDGSLEYGGLWWRMHDHEGLLTYSVEVSSDGLSWVEVGSGGITSSGLGCEELCTRAHPDRVHPPGDQGCPDPMPIPYDSGIWFGPEDINPDWVDRDSHPCAMSFDAYVVDIPEGLDVQLVRLSIGSEGFVGEHVHIADFILAACVPPTPTPTPTLTPTPTPTATPTPYVDIHARNPEGGAVERELRPARFTFAWPALDLGSGAVAGDAAYPRMPQGSYDRFGGAVILGSDDVALGVTPVPPGGDQGRSGNTLFYGWPVWYTGERDFTVVIATTTPTPTPTPTATPTNTPTPSPSPTPTASPTPTPFFSVETALELTSYLHIEWAPETHPEPQWWDYWPHETVQYPFQLDHGLAWGVDVERPPCFFVVEWTGETCYEPDEIVWIEYRVGPVTLLQDNVEVVSPGTGWIPYKREHRYMDWDPPYHWDALDEYVYVIAYLAGGPDSMCRPGMHCLFFGTEPGVHKYEGTVVLDARWSEPVEYIRRYEVQVAGYVDYMPPVSLPEWLP